MEDVGQCWQHPRATGTLELSPQHVEVTKPLYVVLRVSVSYEITSKNSQNLVQTSNKCETPSPSPATTSGAQTTLPTRFEPNGVQVLSSTSKLLSVLSRPRPLLPGRQRGNLFETPSPRTCRCRLPNPSRSKVKRLLSRCRHREGQQAQDSLNPFHWDPIKTLAVAGLPAGNPISQK